jgi:hypothetical protein
MISLILFFFLCTYSSCISGEAQCITGAECTTVLPNKKSGLVLLLGNCGVKSVFSWYDLWT